MPKELFFHSQVVFSAQSVRTRMRLGAAAAICCLIVSIHAADYIHPNAGTAAFPFLEVGYDARAIAMGDAFAGMPSELYGIIGNPASIAHIERRQVCIGFRPVILDIMGTPLAFAFPLKNAAGKSLGVIAAGGIYLSQGSVREIDEMGDETGAVWSAYSAAGGISWAMTVWEALSIGGTLKGIHDHIGSGLEAYSAQGVAIDAGAQYRLNNSRLIIGIAARNLGAVVARYSSLSSDMALPLQAVMGLSYRLQHIPNLRIAFDIGKGYDSFLSGRLGAELDIYKDVFTIRAGYSASRTDMQEALRLLAGNASDTYAKSEWSSFRFGVGLNTGIGPVGVRVDAAYQMRVESIQPSFVLSSLISF